VRKTYWCKKKRDIIHPRKVENYCKKVGCPHLVVAKARRYRVIRRIKKMKKQQRKEVFVR